MHNQDENESPVDPSGSEVMAGVYVRHSNELRRMIVGIVRDPGLADDVLQSAFARAIEYGGPDREESAKAWFFRIAANEALVLLRRQRTADKVHGELARVTKQSPKPGADDPLVRAEAVQAIREALDELPAVQRQVVRARMVEEKRFAEIAKDLGVPIGTVLTRMRRALDRLRTTLRDLNS